ncbi:hypothetical protein [Streptomyces sp. NPDC047315]|uniref:hypothetical protein n=1 Tax=Streptomyces sp. NPDC047315 TaxID=3155142 RepID=UPI0033E16421
MLSFVMNSADLHSAPMPGHDAVADDAPAPIEQARTERRRQAAVTEAAALRRARAERAGATVLSAPRVPAGAR